MGSNPQVMAKGRPDKKQAREDKAFKLSDERERTNYKTSTNIKEPQICEDGSQENKALPIIDHGTPESDAAAELFQTSQPEASQVDDLIQTTNPETASGDLPSNAGSNGPGTPVQRAESRTSGRTPDRNECCDDCSRKLGNHGDEGCVQCSVKICPECARNGICHIHGDRQ